VTLVALAVIAVAYGLSWMVKKPAETDRLTV